MTENKGDLISQEALINAKPEFMNEKVVRDTKYRTAKDRIYAKAWNACNYYWLNTIKNAPAVEEISVIEFKEPLPLVKAQKTVKALSKRPHGEWILNEDENPECPFCHHSYTWFGNFCSNCGADMR